MTRRGARQITTVQRVPAPEPQARIAPTSSRRAQVLQFQAGLGDMMTLHDAPEAKSAPDSLIRLMELASAGGDISAEIGDGVADRIGQDAVREWEIDNGSRTAWVDATEKGLAAAAQESDADEGDGTGKNYPFENASDIHYPIITTATQQFAARAMPELVKGDKVLAVKVLEPGPTGLPLNPQINAQVDQMHQMRLDYQDMVEQRDALVEDAQLMRDFMREIKGQKITVQVGVETGVGQAKLYALAKLVREIQRRADMEGHR